MNVSRRTVVIFESACSKRHNVSANTSLGVACGRVDELLPKNGALLRLKQQTSWTLRLSGDRKRMEIH